MVVLALFLLPKPRLEPLAVVPMSAEPWCLAWERSRKRLWIAQGRRLISWPDAKSYELPFKQDSYPRGNDMLTFVAPSPRGNRMLVTGDGAYWVIDLQTGSVRWKRSYIQSAWWSGNSVSWLEGPWQEPQSLYRAGRRVRLPSRLSLGAIDERHGYALGKFRPVAPFSPPRLLKLNLATGAATTVRKALSESEYEAEDSIQWNPNIRRAIVTYSTDTGGTTSRLEILSKASAHAFDGTNRREGRYLESRPEWFGDSVLANLRTFYEDQNADGFDRYQLELIDGRTYRETLLLSKTAYFSGREDDKRRYTMPRVTLASGLFAHRLIAYSEWTGKRWQVVVCELSS